MEHGYELMTRRGFGKEEIERFIDYFLPMYIYYLFISLYELSHLVSIQQNLITILSLDTHKMNSTKVFMNGLVI